MHADSSNDQIAIGGNQAAFDIVLLCRDRNHLALLPLLRVWVKTLASNLPSLNVLHGSWNGMLAELAC